MIDDRIRLAMCMESYTHALAYLGALIGTLQTPQGGTFDDASARADVINRRVSEAIALALRDAGRSRQTFTADSLKFMVPVMLRTILRELDETEPTP